MSRSTTVSDFQADGLPREHFRHFVGASGEEGQQLLKRLGLERLEDLFSDLPESVRFAQAPELPEGLAIEQAADHLRKLAEANPVKPSFLGDGLPVYKVPSIVPEVCALRGLTTAYTPYQPERSQGTLTSHWIYQCLLSQLTGFEAVNASLYERSTALFEACCCALRLQRKADTVLVSEGIYPGDREVLETLVADAGVRLQWVPLSADSGRMDMAACQEAIDSASGRIAALIFPQVNSLGLLEDVHALANMARYAKLLSVAVIDPMLLASGGLLPPTEFGDQGVDIIVGEAQHLAIGPSFGGPGLGLFGVRFNEKQKQMIRQTPGRFVGRAKDTAGKDCLVQVLSTREQHIRKDKATSNICSNQAFLATLTGAAILQRGETGMSQAARAGHDLALTVATELLTCSSLKLAFPTSAFYNEIVLELPEAVPAVIAEGSKAGVHIGVDVSARVGGGRHLLKLSFSDIQSEADAEVLITFLKGRYGCEEHEGQVRFPDLPPAYRRTDAVGLPTVGRDELLAFYQRLSDLNVSPDDAIYPLGSCTMKYNPHLNDWAATLPGFWHLHPQTPIEDCQGALEVLYETERWFEKITGLAAVTTQPVAGAQGELVGLKLFQAYHRDQRAEGDPERDIILVPKSAHGTNFATASMAGFTQGLVLLEADATGAVDDDDFREKIETYGKRIAGIMITNPNTGGVFEKRFAEIAEAIHAVGGLVYMDGANMNAIAGWVDLGALGVDAVHNNLHKTWSIPHGGGGPGDAIVAVSDKLVDYLPGYRIEKEAGKFKPVRASRSIGSFHRHWGNFGHKVRSYAYLLRLGGEGIREMSAGAVLSARYLLEELRESFPTLPAGASDVPRMHEFILTLSEESFAKIEAAGVARSQIILGLGKLFLDYGYHAPTVAFPEAFGLMIEPTESFTRAELDHFRDVVLAIRSLIDEKPELIGSAPHFTPVGRVDEVSANRQLILSDRLEGLPEIPSGGQPCKALLETPIEEITARLLAL